MFSRMDKDETHLVIASINKIENDSAEFSATEESSWVDELSHGCEDAVVALLLCYLPNLKDLFIEEPYRPDLTLKIVNMASRGKMTVLQKLEVVRASSRESKYGFLSLPCWQRAFFLPKILSFSNDCATPAWQAHNLPWGVLTKSSPVQRLQLSRSPMTTEAVTTLIRSCKGLKTFRYSFGTCHMSRPSSSIAHIW